LEIIHEMTLDIFYCHATRRRGVHVGGTGG
jgi:hypothetical protein